MPENDQTKWMGIRPVNPEEQIPVKGYDETLHGSYSVGTDVWASTNIVPDAGEKWLCFGVTAKMNAGVAGAQVRVLLSSADFDIILEENSDSRPVAQRREPLLISDSEYLKIDAYNPDTAAAHDAQYFVQALRV